MIPTMKDIAKVAGVSQPTVSAVLANKDYCYVSDAKRRLVLETADRMGYMPNMNSRALHGFSTMTIGISSALFSMPINTVLVSAVTHEIWKFGYQTLLGDSQLNKNKELDLIKQFISRGVDGMILSCAWDHGELGNIVPERTPIIITSPPFIESPDYTFGYVDRSKGAALAVRHLLADHGHKAVAFVAESVKGNITKFNGCRDAFTACGADIGNLFAVESENEDELVEKAFMLFLNSGVKAFLAGNDIAAARLINCFHERGVKIPKDAAVVGFDGLEWGNFLQPSLTTVVQPVDRLAKEMSAALVDRIQHRGEKSIQRIVVEPYLRINKSCGCGMISDSL